MLGKQWSPDIVEIGDQIIGLSLLKAKELGDYLKEVHGIEPAGSSMQIVPPIPLPDQQKAPEQSEFTVEMVGFEVPKKIGLIKVVREITGLGLKEAKDLVEASSTASPKPIKEALPKADAEALKKKLEEAGGNIALK